MSGKIGLIPRLKGVGGMVSFQYKLTAGLERRGWSITHDLTDPELQAVLVIGGTRHLGALLQARRRGVPIFQRLDGMNWLHRVKPPQDMGRPTLRHILRAEYGNWNLAWIRAHLANGILYQSHFSKSWWERVHGPTRIPHTVIWNGVDLDSYTPHGPQQRPQEVYRLLLVEGSLMGGYELGLGVAVQLAQGLNQSSLAQGGKPVELMVVGRVPPSLQQEWTNRAPVPIRWAGLVPREKIPELARSAHLFYSADIHPACPNAVIEALACGLPVAAFDTGALPELVTRQAGRVVPYGSDPWRLQPPDVPALVQAGMEILQNQESFRTAARQWAEQAFSLDIMVEAYLQALLHQPKG